MQKHIPEFLMDEAGFYYNPSSPKFPFEPGPGRTIEDLVKTRFSVNLYGPNGRVIPGGKLPKWVKRAGVKQI